MVLTPNTYEAVSGTASDLQLTATVSPSNATDKTISYTVIPQTDGLTVSSVGKVSWSDSAPSGEYVITGTTKDGSFTDTCTLTLTEPETKE